MASTFLFDALVRAHEPIGRLKRFYSHTRQARWALACQMVSSATQFALTIFLIRHFSLAAFGAYTLYYLIALNLAALAHGLISMPTISIAARLRGRDRSMLFSASAFLVFVYFLILLIGALLTAKTVFYRFGFDTLLLCFYALSIFLFDYMRRLLFAANRFAAPLFIETGRAAAMFGALYLLFATSAGITTYIVALSLVSIVPPLLVAGLVFLPSGMALARGAKKQEIGAFSGKARALYLGGKRILKSGGWLGLTGLLHFCNEHLLIIVGSWSVGAGPIGAIRAAQTIVGLINPIVFSLENFLPKSIGAQVHLKRFLVLAFVLMCLLSTPLMLVFLFADLLMAWVGGEKLAAYGGFLQGFCIIYFFLALKSVLSYWFRAIEHTSPVFAGMAVGAVLALVLGYPLSLYLGGFGIVLGLILANGVSALALAHAVRGRA